MTTDPGIPRDDALPGAEGLTGAPGARAVGSFLRARGWHVAARLPVQALYRPGREALVRYRVDARGPGGARRVLTVCADVGGSQSELPPAPDRFVDRFGIDDPVGREGPYLVWAFPYDPSLSALPTAAHGGSVRTLVRRPAPAAVSVQALRYRPRRRAVFRYRVLGGGSEAHVLYGKVLREPRMRRAREVMDGVRGRRVRLATGAEAGGLLLAPALPGRSLRDLLLRGGPLPGPERVAGLLGALEARGSGRSLPDPAADARATVSLIERIAPGAAGDAARVADLVDRGAARTRAETRTVHGDLYENQVFVDEDFSLGLVDLDDVGPGDPAMDAANFSAHLLALAMAVPAAARRLIAYRAILRPALAARAGVDRGELDWREGIAMLKLSTGPFRVLEAGWPAAVRRRVEVALRLTTGG